MDKYAKHIIFSGRVQGVGFRYTARTTAVKFGLTGFVRNLPDGAVEMVIQGEPSDIDMCLKDIADYFGGYIKDSRITEVSYQNQYRNFAITF